MGLLGGNILFDPIIFSNEYIDLIEDGTEYFLKVKKAGYSMNSLNEVLVDYPRVKVTQIVAVMSAIKDASGKRTPLGEIKPMFEIGISKDKLSATCLINATAIEFEAMKDKDVVAEIINVLGRHNVVYGFDVGEIAKKVKPLERFEVAKGSLPIKGDDAVVTYYEIKDAQPETFSNGNVNHYELNLINKAVKGDWLGERIEPKEGVPGKTVTGQIIPALRGLQEKLNYDKKSVVEKYNEESDKTILYASKTGAIVVENNKIGVCNYLEIDGEVSFKTGNVDFDGYVDIAGVVEDNFSVVADQDIQIKGDLGVGGVDQIESREGSIYIRGGIAGKGKAKIICDGDLFTKFAADCEIECGGTVHIGYYAMNAKIKAQEVVFDAFDSKIIGGSIHSRIRVSVGSIGNRTEVPTIITVEGFKRSVVKEEYDFINETIEKVKDKMKEVQQKMAILEMVAATDPLKKEELDKFKDSFDLLKKNLKILLEKHKRTMTYLKSKGEGEIVIGNSVHPKVQLNLGKHSSWVKEPEKGAITYYLSGNELKKV